MSGNGRFGAALRSVAVLYSRETAAYFSSPMAYIVIAAFLLVCGYIFGSQLFIRNRSDIQPFMSIAPLMLTFFVPAVTMRLFAEEAKSGTAELLAALPVSRGRIVAAKFLAGATVIWTALALTAAYPVTVTLVGRPDEGVLFASYLGLFGVAGLFA
ncbi:MAG: ABC transporter permease, partial [Elusimicrobiaceae bacterium]|nr:ABC transporter permease [Elusimicrobiaceae bacterium]